MKTFMNITNYRSKSSNPMAAALAGQGTQIPITAAATAMPVSTTGYSQSQAINQRLSAGQSKYITMIFIK
jgi:hypothetical protein